MILLSKQTEGSPLPNGKPVELRAKLTTKWVNYNCGVRLPGHLRLRYSASEGGNTTEWDQLPYGFQQEAQALTEGHRDELISDFLVSLADRQSYPELKQNSPLFPNDTGRYLPAVVMVPDRLMVYGPALEPLKSWRHLIRYLETNPQFGVQVSRSPLFQNPVYGSEHISAVWTLTFPHLRRYHAGFAESKEIFDRKVEELLVAARSEHNKIALSEAELAELQSLSAATKAA